ncbi:MAG: ribosomal protein S18-alanine N-acetyltransferase [Chloroflexia bacterium]
MPYVIERMSEADVADVVAVDRRCFNTPWPASAYRREVAHPEKNLYVVMRRVGEGPLEGSQPQPKVGILTHILPFRRDGGERNDAPIVGYAGLRIVGDEAHITTIGVLPELRGKYLGEKLLVVLIEHAREQGALWMTLEARVSNQVAQALYAKYTFKEAGRRKRYYSDDGEDAVVMWSDRINTSQFEERLAELTTIYSAASTAFSSRFSFDRRDDTRYRDELRRDRRRRNRRWVAGASSVVASQIEIHSRFGGVVPETASRRHILAIVPVIEAALTEAGVGWGDLDVVAATRGPGLAGSLLVGVNAAKAISWARGLPLVGVNHIEGHIYAAWLASPEDDGERSRPPRFPLLCLVVSGGHTELVLMRDHGVYARVGRTLDDAAGEAFDKAARMLGLPYPGGPAIERAAKAGDGGATLPRAELPGTFNFSFSGLKSALLRATRESDAATTPRWPTPSRNPSRTYLRAKPPPPPKRPAAADVAVVGGVAANAGCASGCTSCSTKRPLPEAGVLHRQRCDDRACAYHVLQRRGPDALDLDVDPNLEPATEPWEVDVSTSDATIRSVGR